MKLLPQLIATCCVLLQLIAVLQARLFLAQNGVIYCKWTSRGQCNKLLPQCVQIDVTIAGTPVSTCKHYKNECQYLIDKCLGKTAFGFGLPVDFATNCMNIKTGSVGTC